MANTRGSVRAEPEEITELLHGQAAETTPAESPMPGFVRQIAPYMLQVSLEDEATAFLGRGAGNRTDVTTVEESVEAMEDRYGAAQRIWVMDRGMTSEDNLEWRRERGGHYLVGTPKSELWKWARQIADSRDWHEVRAGVEAKQCGGPDGAETFS